MNDSNASRFHRSGLPHDDLPEDVAATTRQLERLYAQQRREPDERFVDRLEQQLMATSSHTQPVPPRATQPVRRIGHSGSGSPALSAPRPALPSWLSAAVSFAVLVSIVGGAGFTAWRLASSDGAGRTPTGTLGQSSPAVDASAPEAELAWQLPLPPFKSVETGGMVLSGDVVYRLITVEGQLENDSFQGLEAIRADTGESAWRHASHWSRYGGLAADETSAYFIAAPDQIVALDAQRGDPRWTATLDERVVSMTLAEGALYVWDEANVMTALDVSNGMELWRMASGDETKPEMASSGYLLTNLRPVVGTTKVAMISGDGTVYAFDRGSGDLAWSTPGFDQLSSQIVVTNDVLLVLTHPESVPNEATTRSVPQVGTALRLTDGSTLWTISVTGPNPQPVAPGGTEQFHFIADEVMLTSGPGGSGTPETATTPIADSTEGGRIWPASAQSDDASAYGDTGGVDPGGANVYGIDAKTGQIVWVRTAANGDRFAALAVSERSSEGIWAYTYSGLIVRLAGESGGILDAPLTVGLPLKGMVVGSLEQGIIASVLGGDLVAFGRIPVT